MTYAKIENGAVVKHPYKTSEMKKDFPEVDFSAGVTGEVLTSCSAVVVKMGEVPKYSNSTHKFSTTVEINEDGDAVAVVTATERRPEEAAYNLRRARDISLKQTDWVVTRSAERGELVPEHYLVYRQALRDLTSQEGFPYDCIWPEEPK